MSRGRVRTLIPLMHEDLALWPCPDEAALSNKQLKQYMRRKESIELYAQGTCYQAIQEQTGIRRAEMRRIVKRCLSFNDGEIFGFYALLPYVRIKAYVRTAPIERILGDDSRGCAGALKMLLRQFPEVDLLIHRLLFKRAFRDVHENKIPYQSIRGEVLKKLQELGFTGQHWPFNTVNRGYNAIASYCRELIQKHPVEAAAARYGKSATQRLKISQGFKRLLPEPRCGAYMALDFHVVDAASTITILNNFGVEIPVPVARWYIGLIANPKSSAIYGFHISLETNPSADCLLETLQCALMPPEFVDGDPRKVHIKEGKILVSQLIPELTWQGFAALLVDNAWSNCANDVVNNIMDCIGCAVNFGPAGEWWRRSIIERIFGDLTRRGLQRLPSSYGTGPEDPVRDNPTREAVRFKIRLSEIIEVICGAIYDHNNSTSDGIGCATPIEVLQAALHRPTSGFFLTPLPVKTQQYPVLLQHIETATVRGNHSKGKRPYFKLNGPVYTNETLSNRFDLIDKPVVVYVNRRKPSLVYATVKDTGEDLGLMQAGGRHPDIECPLWLLKLIAKSGRFRKHATEVIDPARKFITGKIEELSKERTTNSKQKLTAPSSTALLISRASIVSEGNADGPTPVAERVVKTEPQKVVPHPPKPRREPLSTVKFSTIEKLTSLD